ncbi:hypothetical protein LINGRAHAP2_LOCUS17676 [Linum grandiflorum]
MESISRKNGCPLNHICQKLCKKAVLGGPTTARIRPTPIATNNDNNTGRLSAPTVVAAVQSRTAATTTGVVTEKPHPSEEKKTRVVSFKPDETGMAVKSSGVHVEDKFGEYIGRVKKKLRTFSTLNSNKHNHSSASSGGGSDEFSDYISHVKNNFTRNPSTAVTNYM